MSDALAEAIELPPRSGPAQQLFVLLHGVGTEPETMMPLAGALRETFANAAIVAPRGFAPFDNEAQGRQWFSVRGIDEENRPERIAAIMPRVIEMVRAAQDKWKVPPIATALGGFSQGAIVSLEAIKAEDGLGGRLLVFGGRYATLPESAPRWTTIHLFHGSDDRVMPVKHAETAMHHLAALNGDVTIDIAHGVGHSVHPALIERALDRLQGRIPIRYWQRAFGGV